MLERVIGLDEDLIALSLMHRCSGGRSQGKAKLGSFGVVWTTKSRDKLTSVGNVEACSVPFHRRLCSCRKVP